MTSPIVSQSARTFTSSDWSVPIRTPVGLVSDRSTSTVPLPTRAFTGSEARVLCCGPISTSLLSVTSSRRSSLRACRVTVTG